MLTPWLQRVWTSWATRSLAVGAGAVALDLTLGVTLITFFGASSRVAAMAGTALGGTFGFFANRYFAFTDTDLKARQSVPRYVLTTVMLSVAHGQAVVILRDSFHVPYVPAKIAADLIVITFTQLILFRFLVFPKRAVPLPVPVEVRNEPPA